MKNQDHELKQQQRQQQQELEQQLMDYKELVGLVGTGATALQHQELEKQQQHLERLSSS